MPLGHSLRTALAFLAALALPASLAAQATAPAAVFPATSVPATSTATVTFTFSATTTLSSVSVVTQGVPNLDFTAGTQNGTACKAGTFLQNSTCTVVVNFKPATPGLRTGAVLLYDNGATPAIIATGYLSGTGNSAEAVIYPGTETTVFPSLAGTASGVVLDSNGNIFLSTSSTGVITKETYAAGSYTASTFGSNLSQSAYNFAIDGAGNVFYPYGYTYKNAYTPSTGTYTQSTASQYAGSGVIIDPSNNLFLTLQSNLIELAPNASGYTETTAGGGFRSGYGLAFDSNLDVFVADAGNSNLVELPCASGTCNGSYPTTINLASNVGNIVGVATDPAGTVYVAANYTPALLRYLPNGSSAATVLPQVGTFNSPDGVALDRLGNVFITDNGSGQALKEINVSAPQTFAFGATVVGSPASPKTATLTNIGNTPMTLTGLAFSNPAFSSGTASTCTASTVLQPTGSCTVAVQFAPTATVAYNATLTFTDNALGVPGSTQTVNLTGNGAENLAFTTAPPLSTQTGGNVGSVTVAFETYNNSIDTTQTSTITLKVTGPGSYSQTYTQPASNGQATFNLSAAALTATGGYVYTPSATATGATFYANTAGTTVYPYKLALSGLTSPQTASNTTNTITVAVVTNSGAATTQTNQITLTVTGPSGYTTQTYGPTTTSASTGAVTFTTAALTTAGTYTYTASSNASPDGVAVTGTAPTQTVVAGPAASLTVAPSSTSPYVGQADALTVTAHDAFGNLANSTNDTVAITSSDSTATLPANFALVSGTANTSIKFGQPGTFTVTATDTTSPSVTGTSNGIQVIPVPSYTVTTLNDDSGAPLAGNCSNQSSTGATLDSSCSLRDALAATNALNFTGTTNVSPTIGFAPTLSGGTVILAAALNPTANVSIAGPGAASLTIAPTTPYTYNAFTSTTNSIVFTLSGVTVTGFGIPASNSGAALYFAPTGASASVADLVTLSNDSFTANGGTPAGTTASSSGGALFMSYSTLAVTGSTFTGNSAGIAGAIDAAFAPSVTITGSVFGTQAAPNRALSSNGGAVYLPGSPATVSNSTFAFNTATSAGAIESTSTLTLNTDVFLNNAASTSGGAVYGTGALTIAGSTFNNNTAKSFGGAVFASNPLTISGSSFMGNQISGSTVGGGAIYSSYTSASSTITNTNFQANRAVTTSGTAYGGALYIARVNLTNVLFSGNYTSGTSTTYGGAVYLNGTTSGAINTWTGVTLTGNATQTPGGTTGATIQDGGAVYQTTVNATLSLYNTTATANSSKSGGGLYKSAGTLNLYNSVISGNTASSSYADAFTVSSAANSYFNSNSAASCAVTTSQCTPVLSALGSYGGGTVGAPGYTTPVQTMIPLPGSPLLAAGSSSYIAPAIPAGNGGATADPRGLPRTTTYNSTTHVDIGAAEANYTLAFAQQPTNSTVNTPFSPVPTVQIAESGNPFNATGGILALAASAGIPSSSSVSITASPVPLNVTFPAPESADTLLATIATSTGTALATSTSTPFNITAAAAQLAFGTAPATPITAGGNAGSAVTVLVEDNTGSTVTGSAASVTLAVTYPNSSTQTYTATAANGTATFNLATPALTAAGTYTYTASSTGLTSATASESVTAGPFAAFTLSTLLAETQPGVAQPLTVTAADSFGNPVPTFTGTVSFSSTDAIATLPAPYTFTASDAGAHTFSVAFNTGGTDALTVSSGTNTASQTGILIGDAILIVDSTGSLSRLTDAGTATSPSGGYTGGGTPNLGIAIDSSGNIFSLNSTSNLLVEFSKSGTALSGSGFSGGGLNTPVATAIDGAGQIWIANSGNSSISTFSNTGTPISPATGYTGPYSAPSALTIDTSGNVWVTNQTSNSVTEILGGATPVTPLTQGITNASTATKP